MLFLYLNRSFKLKMFLNVFSKQDPQNNLFFKSQIYFFLKSLFVAVVRFLPAQEFISLNQCSR